MPTTGSVRVFIVTPEPQRAEKITKFLSFGERAILFLTHHFKTIDEAVKANLSWDYEIALIDYVALGITPADCVTLFNCCRTKMVILLHKGGMDFREACAVIADGVEDIVYESHENTEYMIWSLLRAAAKRRSKMPIDERLADAVNFLTMAKQNLTSSINRSDS